MFGNIWVIDPLIESFRECQIYRDVGQFNLSLLPCSELFSLSFNSDADAQVKEVAEENDRHGRTRAEEVTEEATDTAEKQAEEVADQATDTAENQVDDAAGVDAFTDSDVKETDG